MTHGPRYSWAYLPLGPAHFSQPVRNGRFADRAFPGAQVGEGVAAAPAMGVHGLWDLLAPVGRRVSVDTLAGKKLAIGLPSPNPTNSLGFVLIPFSFFFLKFFGGGFGADASIWMIQFMKAMRDEKGEVVRNAHLLGFFRRICKLLFLRTKPVFVFDGGTPALKRRTVIARRRHRENAKAKIRKTAEKLLLNHVRSLSFFFSVFLDCDM